MTTDTGRYIQAERRLWRHLGGSPVERHVTLGSGERVRVQELGEGPPFVLIHGGSVCGTSWATLATALDDVRCILVDRPGCGLSEPIAGGHLRDLRAVERYADRLLVDVLDALSKLTMPVLILWGEDDPNGRAATVGRSFSTRLPDAELVIVPGAEHAPWLDDLNTCVSQTRRFLFQ